MEEATIPNEELEALNALDTQGAGAGGDEEIDQSLLYQQQDRDLSGADDEWDEGRYPFQITALKLKASKKAPNHFRYLELELTCIAGPKRDRKFFDRVMIEGDKDTALARLVVLGKATDMYDPDTKKFSGAYISLVNKCVWADITKKKEVYNGEERERANIAFRGYHHFSKFVLPDENDVFAETGDALEALDVAPLPPVEEVAEAPVQEEVYEEAVEEQPFADDVPEPVAVEEPAPVAAPRPAPRPAATAPRPAAAAPRPAAAAPKAGDKPPF